MSKLKLVTIVGTRPEIIKLSTFIKLADENFDHILVHTGQNYDYELNQVFFEQLSIRKPDFFLDISKNSPAEAISDVIKKSDELFETLLPDALLVYGDTNSCLCVISAKRRKIPIFHMEAGNRCFDSRVPEEINRKIVDHLSDINMPLTEHARRYLIHEGLNQDRIFKIGSTLPEVIQNNIHQIHNSSVLKDESLEKDKYFLMSFHREENVDTDNLFDLLNSIEAIRDEYKIPIIISTHPRTKKRLEDIKFKEDKNLIRFIKPFGFNEYLNLQINALCVISDSGTLSEEASLLNFRAITIRNAHERPEAIDNGIFIMSGLKKESLLNSLEIILKEERKEENSRKVLDYESQDTSMKVIKIIQSYKDYVNRVVWYQQ